jgi:1,4-alpha-glucan branching enzyme
MTDANNDGVYEITLDVPSGEIEYKFTVDGWAGQESFEAGTPCTKTTQEFTNRVANIESETSLPTVCFNTCAACE